MEHRGGAFGMRRERPRVSTAAASLSGLPSGRGGRTAEGGGVRQDGAANAAAADADAATVSTYRIITEIAPRLGPLIFRPCPFRWCFSAGRLRSALDYSHEDGHDRHSGASRGTCIGIPRAEVRHIRPLYRTPVLFG